MEKLTRIHCEATIRDLGIERAWKALGIARTTLYRWRREWRAEDRRAKRERDKARVASSDAVKVERKQNVD